MENQNYEFKESQQKVPYAVPSLILGIVSIAACCAYGAGIVCAIIGLVLSGKGSGIYKADPLAYDQSSYKMLNAGRICSIIGLILSIISVIILIILIAVGAWDEMFRY